MCKYQRQLFRYSFLTHKSLLFLSRRANKKFGIKNESGIKISNTENLLVDAEKNIKNLLKLFYWTF